MKLAAIYNVWDGVELLKHSMESVKNKVDIFIIVFSNYSNYGEYYAPLSDMDLKGFNYVLKLYNPEIGHGAYNEKIKRNIGLDLAKSLDCTHFLHMDCDEIYQDFELAVSQYKECGTPGSVAKLYTYFKTPFWRLENEDNYFVPFIHELTPDTFAGFPNYPFYVDPTRSINCDAVTLLPVCMHHFSYVRKDIERKCRNSSAKINIEKSQLLQDYYDPDCGPGFFIKDFNQKLIEVENDFNITI